MASDESNNLLRRTAMQATRATPIHDSCATSGIAVWRCRQRRSAREMTAVGSGRSYRPHWLRAHARPHMAARQSLAGSEAPWRSPAIGPGVTRNRRTTRRCNTRSTRA